MPRPPLILDPVKLTLYMPGRLIKDAKVHCETHKVSLSAYITDMLKQHLNLQLEHTVVLTESQRDTLIRRSTELEVSPESLVQHIVGKNLSS